MFDKILVPLDGSEHSEKIGGFVAGLARPLGSTVTLLAVVNPDDIQLPDAIPTYARPAPGPQYQARREPDLRDPYQGRPIAVGAGMVSPMVAGTEGHPQRAPQPGTEFIEQAVEYARHYLLAQAQRLDASGVQSQSEVRVGAPAEEIVRYAKENRVDMIAMATQRESALARGVLGSVTDRVLHSTSVPLLAIHPKNVSAFSGNAGAPNIIIVPLDGSALSEAAVPVALGIAEDCSAEVIFMRTVRFPYYGVTGPGIEYYAGDYGTAEQRREAVEYLAKFVEEAEGRKIKARAHAAIGNAAFRIIEEAENLPGSMIVMSTHGTGGFKRWVVGSVTDKVVRSSGVPVLVLPPRSEESPFGR